VFKSGGTLRRIEGDPHDFLMYPQKCKRAIWGYKKDQPLCNRLLRLAFPLLWGNRAIATLAKSARAGLRSPPLPKF
jgi:hypothetical protein